MIRLAQVSTFGRRCQFNVMDSVPFRPEYIVPVCKTEYPPFHLGLNFAPLRPVPVNSGQFRLKFIFLPVWILASYFHFLNFVGIFFTRSPKILLILSSVSHFCTCSSLSLYHLSLSDPLNRDREVENKIEEQDEAKMVWLVKQKGRRRRRWEEEKIAQKVKWWRNSSNNERSSILSRQ